MHHNIRLLKAAVLSTFAIGALATLSACDNGEPVSAARISVAKSPSTTEPPPVTTTTTAPAATSASHPSVSTPPSSATAVTPPTAKPVTNVAPETLSVVTDPKLGKIVTDNGFTLYRMNSDGTNPPKSNCAGDCAKRFPPLLLPADGLIHVSGVDPALVGRLARADRTIQLTLAGHPLYRYVGDTAPGETLGHNFAGAVAIGPTGAAVQTR
jgi:predicted lipoprotein with Yx(FWY)xxD motif